MNTNYYQKKLEEERITLERELGGIARINPQNPNDWEPIPTPGDDTNQDPDPNVAADAVEDFQNKSAVEVELESRLRSVEVALKQIEEGGFGICGSCGENIEEDRLEANPAATTCKEHMNP